MSRPLRETGAQVRIGAVVVHAASAIDARRLADALPRALAQALAGEQVARPGAAERAAGEIVTAIEAARSRAA